MDVTDLTALDHGRTWYDRIAPLYGLIDGLEAGPRLTGIEALELKPGERVLEIGPGPGAALVELARGVLPGGHVTGVDLSRAMLELSRRRLLRSGLSGSADLVQADARRMPFPEGIFHAVYMGFTLELFAPSDMRIVLDEVARVLSTGGRIGVVALLATPRSVGAQAYGLLHRLAPAVVDCRPIDVAAALSAARFTVAGSRRLSLWGLPVAVVMASAPPAV